MRDLTTPPAPDIPCTCDRPGWCDHHARQVSRMGAAIWRRGDPRSVALYFGRSRTVAEPGSAPVSEPPLPSRARMAGGLVREVATTVGRACSGRSTVARPETIAARLAICEACPHYRPSDGRCGVLYERSGRQAGCGCYLKRKTRRAGQSCPIGKWGPESDGPAITSPDRTAGSDKA